MPCTNCHRSKHIVHLIFKLILVKPEARDVSCVCSFALHRPSAVIFDVSVRNEVVPAVMYLQWKDRQCIKIKAVQTETTYPDLQMIFTRSIPSSAQTSGHRLTQPPLTTPKPNTHKRCLSLPHAQTHTCTPKHTPCSVRALGLLIGLYWLTHRTTTCTHLLVGFIFHWRDGVA